MIKAEDVYKIGRIGKTHGVKGEVSFLFDDDIFDRVDADYIILDIDGILVPFFMEEYRFRNDTVCLVKFCAIDTQQRAQELTGCDVYFPRALVDEADIPTSLNSLVGFSVVSVPDCNTTGRTAVNSIADSLTVGTIASIDDSTENILFELEDGRLIPASDDLIETIDTTARTIAMRLPAGILDL